MKTPILSVIMFLVGIIVTPLAQADSCSANCSNGNCEISASGQVSCYCSGGDAVCKEVSNLISLASFKAETKGKKVIINWETASEIYNAGFLVLRGVAGGDNGYIVNTLTANSTEETTPKLGENCSTKIQGDLRNADDEKDLIPAVGTFFEGTCYSFTDIPGEGTFYYLLKDFDLNGKETTHCDNIVAITVGEGAIPDIESAIRACKGTL